MPEVVRIAVLPISERHDICPPLPAMTVHIALVVHLQADHRHPRAHMLQDGHLVRVLVPLAISKLTFPVMAGILRDCVCDLPVCATSAVVCSDFICRMCPVYDPASEFTEQESAIFLHERFSLTCFLPITNHKRCCSLFLFSYLLPFFTRRKIQNQICTLITKHW